MKEKRIKLYMENNNNLSLFVFVGVPHPTPGAEYGQYSDTKYQSSFFFGCQNTFKLAGETDKQ